MQRGAGNGSEIVTGRLVALPEISTAWVMMSPWVDRLTTMMLMLIRMMTMMRMWGGPTRTRSAGKRCAQGRQTLILVLILDAARCLRCHAGTAKQQLQLLRLRHRLGGTLVATV